MIATALMTVALPAFVQSQTSPPANQNGSTPAVSSPNCPPTPGAPVAGANSFTEAQAKSRIEANGFSNVSELKKGRFRRMARQGVEGHREHERERGLPGQRRQPIATALPAPFKPTGHTNDYYDLTSL